MSSFGDPESKAQTYSRKEKSLGLLCVNFLCLYSKEQVDSVSLDEAASRLGVERRRIYDIVNVLESVGVLVRKAKNRYTWKGYDGIPKALERLREAALNGDPNNGVKKSGTVSDANGNNAKDCLESDDEEEEEQSTNENCPPNNANLQAKRTLNKNSPISVLLEASKTSPAKSKADCRREKSLGLLTQKFVQLFLVTQAQVVSLEDAARLLLGECKESAKLKTKVRRLYDIANVLSSLNLIEKTHNAENRKPAFKWLGIKENPTFPAAEMATRKRQFGTVLSSNAIASAVPKSKRGRPPTKENRLESPVRSSKRSSLKPLQPRCTNKGGAVYNPVPSYPREGSSMPIMPEMPISAGRTPTTLTLGSCGGWREWTTTDSHRTEAANRDASNSRLPPMPPAFTFGPFCPLRIQQQCIAGCPSSDPLNNNMHSGRERSARDFDGMPPLPLHYQNEALAHMVAHFMDAWKSWYLQVSTPSSHSQVPVSESVKQPCDSATEAASNDTTD